MKKVMFGLACAAAMIACADVESANVVGYTTKTIPAGKWMMVSAQLDKIGGGMLTFDEAFKVNVTGPKAWESEEDEECIPGWTANAPKLKIPYGTVDKLYKDLFWTQNAYDDDLGFVEGWADADGFLVKTQDMLKGYGVWMVAGEDEMTVTVSGEVISSASDTISAATGWNMLKMPFPIELNAGDSKIDWNLGEAAVAAWESEEDEECISGWTANAPTLKIPYGTLDMLYKDLFYCSNAYSDDLGFVQGWADADGFLVTDATIPTGMAFWFVVKAPVTATVTK